MAFVGVLGFLIGWACFGAGLINYYEQTFMEGVSALNVTKAVEAFYDAKAFTLAAWYSFVLFFWISIGILILFFILAIIDAIERVK